MTVLDNPYEKIVPSESRDPHVERQYSKTSNLGLCK